MQHGIGGEQQNKKIRKDLVVHSEGGVLYCADCGFRSRIGVPIIDGKSELGIAILRDYHFNGRHVQGVEHAHARIEQEFYITGIKNQRWASINFPEVR